MEKFIALLLFSVSLFVTASHSQCPEISMMGPVGITPPGETMKFTVEVRRDRNEAPLKYAWRVSSGTINSGQATPSIEVKREDTSLLTVTVEIVGLPENCPNTFTDSSFGDPPPTPIRVGVWKKDSDLSPLKQFSADMAIEATHQGYIFIVRGPSSTPESLKDLKETVVSFSPKEGAVYSPRITIVEVEGPEQLIELWRVPPGANNPECQSCHKQECPELAIEGPAGIPTPGELLKYSLTLNGRIPRDLRYRWEVNVGQIVSGQGTKAIQILPAENNSKTLVVSVEISGLPQICPATASEMAPIVDYFHPILIDEFEFTPSLKDLDRLGRAYEELRENPAHQLFVIMYHPRSESQFKVREVIKKLTDFLDDAPDLGSDRYSVVSSPSDKYLLRIYRIPPGTDNPTP